MSELSRKISYKGKEKDGMRTVTCLLFIFAHRFEKMISGLYMGEMVRLILVKMAQQRLLFQGKTTAQLLTTGSFKTSYIYTIDNDK